MRGAVAVIKLNRPDFHNAQSIDLLKQLDSALARATNDDDVNCLMLMGEGPSFSAGHDLKAGHRNESGLLEPLWNHERPLYYDLTMRIHDCPKPVVAGVHGYLAMGGLMLAAQADLIIAADNAKFWAQGLGMFGLSMSEVGYQPFEFGVRKAKEFIWLGRVWDAAEMEKMGFVMKVVPLSDLEAETMALATQISNLPPWATRLTKKSLNHAADLMGKREYFEYHFLIHELAHLTEEARDMRKLREGKPTQVWVKELRERVGYPHPQSTGSNHKKA
jgi:enoyl-CoA hydratase